MTDLHASPPDGSRPGFAVFADAWSRTRLVPIAPLDPRLEALARTLKRLSNIGGVLLTQFEVHPDPELAEFFAHNRIEADFFSHFFGHPDVLEALGLPPKREPLGFGRSTGENVFKGLVGAILMGGAYRPFKGTERDARRLATDFAAAIGPRFMTASAWVSASPWTGWFQDVAWDRSFFWFDRSTLIATVLLTTDTD